MKQFQRSRANRVIGGVCGGLGGYFNIEPVLVRLVFVFSIFIPPLFGIMLLTYAGLWIFTPREPAVQPDTAAVQEQKNLPRNGVFTVIAASALIILGVLLLFPGLRASVWNYFPLIFSAVLALLGIRLVADMAAAREWSVARASAAFFLLSFALITALDVLNIVKTGVYAEYGKLLLPAVLILIGVSLITKDKNFRAAGVVLAGLAVAGITTASIVNARYELFDGPVRFMRGMLGSMPHGINMQPPQVYTGLLSVTSKPVRADYRLVNRAGRLVVSVSTNWLDYRAQGLAPEFGQSGSNGILTIDFANMGADARANILEKAAGTMDLTVSGGDLDADIGRTAFHTMLLNVSAGNAEIILPALLTNLQVRVSAGRCRINLPASVPVRVKTTSRMAHLDLGGNYRMENGDAVYEGKGQEMLINADVSVGSLEIRR